MMKQEIRQGVILEVVKDFEAKTSSTNKSIGDRKVVIKAGEKIEIRYPYEWHFRTEDNCYFQADEPVLQECCKWVGKIDYKVFFRNRASLEEILRLELFEKVAKW